MLARLRHPQRRRPLRPARARRADRRRRLPVQRQGARPPDVVDELQRVTADGAATVWVLAPATGPTRPPEGGHRRAAPTSWSPANDAPQFDAAAVRPRRCGCSTPPAPPGMPKGIVHGHGGTLLEQMKSHALRAGRQGPTTASSGTRRTSWMMWNIVVSSLLVGSTIALYDGSPMYPDAGGAVAAGRAVQARRRRRQRRLHARQPEGRACSRARSTTCRQVRIVGSTGSPLPASGFRWVVRSGEGRRVARSPAAAAPTWPPASSAAAPLAPVRAGRDPGAAARRQGGGMERRRQAGGRRGRRAGGHRADAVDAAVLLERPRRGALPRRLLRHLPRRVAARRLDDRAPWGRSIDQRPVRLDPQPHGRAHGQRRDLRGGRGPARDPRGPGDRRRAARRRLLACRCSSCWRTAWCSTTS